MPCVAKEVAVNGNSFPLNLVSPSCKITITSNRLGYIYPLCGGKGFTTVEGFQPSEFVAIFLNKVCKNVEQPSSLGRVHPSPRPSFKRRPRSMNGLIHIDRIGCGNLADFLAC